MRVFDALCSLLAAAVGAWFKGCILHGEAEARGQGYLDRP